MSGVRTREALPGTRPAGAQDDVAAARQVREMFSRIAPHYDLLNHLLSAGFDVMWRRRVAARFAEVLTRGDVRALDLCCGTGDLTFALRDRARRGGRDSEAVVIGADFAHPMLVRACEKAGARRERGAVSFMEADALRLPFADRTFDLVTTAFGFRNLANYAQGLAELRRILRPGGSAAILEFAEPESAVFGTIFRFYFHRVLPKIGGIVSSNSQAYGYLPSSVARFPRPAALAELMQHSGFSDVRFERWTGGIVALHTGRC